MKKLVGVFVLAVLIVACGGEKSLFQQARLAQAKGNYAKALSLYNQLIKQNPNHTAALSNRALVWEKMPAKDAAEKAKNRRFAEQDYLHALEINHDLAETHNNLGALYMDMGQRGTAIEYFTQAILLRPTYFQALLNRGTAYSQVGDYIQALSDFNEAEKLRPHDTALLYNRALMYFNREKYEAAIYDLTHAIAVAPNNADLYVARARALNKYGFPADAYDDLTHAISLRPDHALAYYYLGDILYRNGDTDYALGALVKAKELDNDYAPTYDLMGDMLAMSDPVSATANYLVALKLDPQNAPKYQAKLAAMKSEEGRYQVLSARFFPQGRAYTSTGERRFAARPIPTGVQAQQNAAAQAQTARAASAAKPSARPRAKR